MRKPDVDSHILTLLLARIFPNADNLTLERAATGITTRVYRINTDGTIHYLRLASTPELGLAPEAWVHCHLRARGVCVSDVIYFDPYDTTLRCAVMVTTAIPGVSIGEHFTDIDTHAVLVAAGRDLAMINSVPVDGYGWIIRDGDETSALRAEYPTYDSLLRATLDEHLGPLRDASVLSREMTLRLRARLMNDCVYATGGQAWLAHGDFDTAHIFHDRGRYSGIIDFGDMRGADRFFDLGYFLLHDGERIPEPVFPYLLEGYETVTRLPGDARRHIEDAALLIGVRSLGRVMMKYPREYQRAPRFADVVRKVKLLADEEDITL